jgi:NAD(P)-dependent dehydrogenase (short-subunit alcohol dehydrogenase family)
MTSQKSVKRITSASGSYLDWKILRVVFISGGSSGIGAELVNNAGRDDRHALDELTPEYWDNCLNLNLRHQVFTTQSVARQLRAAGLGGSIINMGSISWMRGRPNLIGHDAHAGP